ncbi:MAG: PD40 domain-containing protein [Candidatus Rokubacteria bacterium]|nr:PD40 domain-containing protein [Candidatus Rokubacteria bacterium]
MLRWALDRRTVLKLGVTGAGWALIELIRARRASAAAPPLQPDPRERRLANLRQLTFGGQNAEAYFDWTGTRLVFQSTRPPVGCDQSFPMRADGSDVRLVSTGKGRTTCSFFFPDGKRFLYASTHLDKGACPPPPDRSRGYVWPIYPGYEIFSADVDGGDLRRLTENDGYDAEGAVSPDGSRIVFTSLRDGDLDLYVMDADGSNVRRLTDRPGYDGGPFFSWDGRFIVLRSAHPETRAELDEYRMLLGQGVVRPRALEIFVMRADGTGLTQVTRNGAANFAPFMHPNSRQVIFSSNLHDPTGRSFALYLINVDGSGLERLTYADSFASFPMFSRDGTRLVFCGNRYAVAPREINVLIADWEA